MSSLSIAGVGAQFYRWDGNDWESIAEVRAIVGPSMNKDTIDVTSLDTADGYNKFTAGFLNGGEISLAMSFTRLNYELFKNDFEDSDARFYGIMLPDEEETFLDFIGLVTELPLGITADDKIDCNVKIKISGVLGTDVSFAETIEDYVDLLAFLAGDFDFENKKWKDVSGNENHISLVGASARTGNGANLDYTITGLLTSDSISVVSGSDIPTIPSDGILRIGASQTVYGVTITRSGSIWAIIPFCEPYINENIPTISYDVSGNGHHSICSTLAEGNITTQDNYFYLLKYGYSLRSAEILGWDTSQWSGNESDYSAVFAGPVVVDAQSSTNNLSPSSDGKGCIYYYNGVNFRLREYSVLTIGKRYRFTMSVKGFSSSIATYSGIGLSSISLVASAGSWVIGNGNFDLNGLATAENFELKPANTTAECSVEFYDPKLYLLVVVPALITGVADAVGNTIEYVQDGHTWLRYGANLKCPEVISLQNADQKGDWSDMMMTGYCVSGETYKIEKTTLDYFGVGLKVNDEFISDGSELLNRSNTVRQLLRHASDRGFLFSDAGVSKVLTYDDFEDIKSDFLYCKKPKTAREAYYPEPGIVYPRDINNGLYGWKKYDEGNIITELAIVKDGIYLSSLQKSWFNNYFKSYHHVSHAMITFVWDHLATDDWALMLGMFEAHGYYSSNAINYALGASYEVVMSAYNAGHEIALHTAVSWQTGTFIPEYVDFYDTSVNYTEAQLASYYAAAKQYYLSQGILLSPHKIYPGGGYDQVTANVVLDHFRGGYMASGSASENRMPIMHPEFLGRQGLVMEDSAGLETAKGYVDDAIANKSWVVFYAHPSTEWLTPEAWSNFNLLLDYIAERTASGDMIRQYPLKEAFEIIQKEV